MIIYDGIKWYQKKNKYYETNGSKKDGYKHLHRYIWEKYNGKIPDGYYIHHKDLNRENNDISNLQMVTLAEHNTIHSTGKKLSKKHIDLLCSINTGNKYAIGNTSWLGRKHTEESKKKMSKSHKGKVINEEGRKNMSNSQKNRWKKMKKLIKEMQQSEQSPAKPE